MKTSTLIYKYIALQIFRPKKTSIFILYFFICKKSEINQIYHSTTKTIFSVQESH